MENKIVFGKFVWEDLVVDFLEMACFLKEEEQAYLIRQLSRHHIRAESMEVHPCFSIQGKMVIICDEVPVEECWLYFSKKKQIRKLVEEETPEAA